MATAPKKQTPSKKSSPAPAKKDLTMKSVATTIKAQGEMKQRMSPPKSASKTFSKAAQEAGRKAAEASREEGKRIGAIGRGADLIIQKINNSGSPMGAKRNKSGGTIDKGNRYSGLNNKQLK